jgi:hypothetical protein
VAATLSGPIQAQEQPGSDVPSRSKDPIDLSADQIQTWTDAEGRWFLLTGPTRVAVLQGIDEGLRAQQAVVRIKGADGQGPGSYLAEVYAEGNVVPVGRRAKPVATLSKTLRSTRDARPKPYDKGAITRLAGPPKDAPILGRAFPRAQVAAAPAPPQSARAAPESRPTPPVTLPPADVPRQSPGPPSPEALPPLPPTVAPTVSPRPMPVPAQTPPVAATALPPPVQATPIPPQVAPTLLPPPLEAAPLPPQVAPTVLPPPVEITPIPPQVAPTVLPLPVEATVTPPRSSQSGQSVPAAMPPVVALPAPAETATLRDSNVGKTQFGTGDVVGGFGSMGGEDLAPPVGAGALPGLKEDESPPVGVEEIPALPPALTGPGTVLEPLPGPDGRPLPPLNRELIPESDPNVAAPPQPIMPGSQRITRILPRNGGPNYTFETLKTKDGVSITVIRGGVQIVCEAPQFGIIDLSADSAVIWRQTDPKNGGGVIKGPNGEDIDNVGQPLEVYLEGNVLFLQDERKVAGNGDQKTFKGKSAYYDFRTDRFVLLDGELNMFGPGMIAPAKVLAPRIDQFKRLKQTPDGKYILGRERIQADYTTMTGSRFPNPGYTFNSSSVDMTRVKSYLTDPNTNTRVGAPPGAPPPEDLTWLIDAKNNVFWMGPIPTFYHPRFYGNADDLEPPIRAFIFRTNNYFGQQFLADFNGFRILGIRKPKWIDTWNIDVDELTARGLALGTEFGWNGRGILRDLTDPYHREPRSPTDPPGGDYFGYFDIWGLQDHGNDVLGPGPAVVTNNNAQANTGIQRTDQPAFMKDRGKIEMRHMQSLLDPEAEQDEDFRFQLELGAATDRNFMEEYFQRIFQTGLDQETLAYLIRQKENRAWDVMSEVNLNPWQTESQWLPRGDYYRLGDSLLGNRVTYFQHSGADFANTHPAVEVNNPYLFAYLPYDPISNTSQTLRAGRFYTNHEIDVPFQFDFIRFIPYVQGQAVGWTNQIGGEPVGRVWGGVGARASVMASRAFPKVESEIFNVHGLYHKLNFDVDARDAWSNVKLDTIGVQDDLDDNTYEYVRRYLALTDYAGGLLPPQYDPRHLILRRMMSPISGPTDIQASLESVQMALHQRLQTKRGPEGRRRVIDYMTLDLQSTYFPYSSRDNFGKPFGQNMYNWQWFLGDRTSIVSYGWFEFWNLGGQSLNAATNVSKHNDPFGLNVITTGLSISRPPRGSVYLGYTIIDTGPIDTSALTVSINYWLSPKWYGAFSTVYDFGNAVLLGEMFSFTRIGADYLTTIGLTVDPQRSSYMFAFMLSPRISPNIRFGSGLGMNQFDSRYAPTQ